MGASAYAEPRAAGPNGRLYVELAAGDEDVRASQGLRYRVFSEEMGAQLASASLGLDIDAYDAYCHHLLVREPGSGRVVASTRLLSQAQAEAAGGFYSESEFDLTNIKALAANGSRLLEVGRTCVDPAYRRGAAIAVLWSGLAGYVRLHGFEYLFGCASVDLTSPPAAAAILGRLRTHAAAERALAVIPRRAVEIPEADATLAAPMPPLLKAYVRLGARICGEPCLDPEFNVADALMLLRLEDLDPLYERHFLSRLDRG